MGIELIKRDTYRAIHDNVFSMLYDMSEERTEQNILLPLLEMIEENFQENKTDKYDFYFTEIKPCFKYDYFKPKDIKLLLIINIEDISIIEFIRKFAYKYRNVDVHNTLDYDNKLFEYLKENKNYEIRTEVNGMDIMDNEELYKLFKLTWIGDLINTIANLRDTLICKRKKYELNLNDLLLNL